MILTVNDAAGADTDLAAIGIKPGGRAGGEPRVHVGDRRVSAG